MTTSKDTINSLFGQKVRVRACGVLVINDQLLLAHHKGIGPEGEFWIPPGGGVEVSETLQQCLIREFREETGLNVEAGKLLNINEFINLPHHALEFFFQVKLISGNLKTGFDPELGDNGQIITDVRFVPVEEVKTMPAALLHPVLHGISSFQEILDRNAVFISA